MNTRVLHKSLLSFVILTTLAGCIKFEITKPDETQAFEVEVHSQTETASTPSQTDEPLPTQTPEQTATKAPILLTTSTSTPTSLTLEVFSHWTEGQHLAGFNALIDEHTKTTNVGITISSDYEELSRKIVSGNPPDSFHAICGNGNVHADIWQDPLWTEEPSDYLRPVTLLWSTEGWFSKFPQDLIDMLSYQGELYCVPLNISRSNVLWYNKAVFSKIGLASPTTFTEFFNVAEALETAGKIPIALGFRDWWVPGHIMGTILLGTMGPDKYRGLWNGTTPFNGPEVMEALKIYDRMMDYVNSDYSSLTWQQAVQLVGKGQAGMIIMGDWALGDVFRDMGLLPNIDYGWTAAPGSIGSFMTHNDSFVMLRNAPNFENATSWLKTVGSLGGQDAFNTVMFSIPARLDADPSKYGLYQQWAMADYATNELVPELMLGDAAPSSFARATERILKNFIANRNVDQTALALQEAACVAGFTRC